MSNLINPILAIGIRSNTPTTERLAKTFFNIDCLLAILSTFCFIIYCISSNAPIFTILIVIPIFLIYCFTLYINKIGHYTKAIYLSTFFSYFAIVLSSFLAPYYWIPFYLIQLGISFFIYLAHEQKKSFYLFSFFTLSSIVFFVIPQLLIHQPYQKDTSADTFPVVLFLGLCLYKISALIYIYQKIITESNLKEKALQASENKYKIQFESTQLGMIVLNKDLIIYDVNPSFIKMIGFSKEEILNSKTIDHCLNQSIELNDQLLKLKSGKITKFEFNKTFTKKDGTALITNGFISGVYDEQNEFICSNCSFLDITNKVKTEEVIEQNESKYRDIFENMNDSIVILDADGNIIEFNAAATNLFETEELGFLNIGDIIHPEDVKKSTKYFKKLKDEGSYSGFQGRIIIPGDKIKYIEVDSIAIIDENGNFAGSRDIAKDITDRKLTETALIEKESRYRTIFENAFEGLMIFDINKKKWTECNSKVLDMFSTDQETLFNNTKLFFPEFQDNDVRTTTFFNEKVREVASKKSLLYQCTLQDSNQNILDAEVTTIQTPAPNENLIVFIIKDITEKNKQEAIIQDTVRELNNKNEDLQKYIESNMQLENFAYMASHDLKAPLRTITSYIQLIHRRSKHKFDDTDLEFLDFIIGAAKNMGKLIDALLAYSKVDTQEKAYKFFNIETLINSITQELHTDIEENQIKIRISDMPNLIFADPTRLRQLFQNLISNSIKFKSSDHPPLIEISCEENETEYQFSFQDNGIGIKEEFFEKIFSLFTKLHSSNEYEGTGIGLALCKKIVEQHEGKIWLESKIEKGTTFLFTISKSLSKENTPVNSISISSMMN